MRSFFISDIHGHFRLLHLLLEYVAFKPSEDQLIIGGNMIDRGPDGAAMLHWAKKQQETYPENIHITLGNHEDMMIWFMKELSPAWMEFGGEETMESFEQKYGEKAAWDQAKAFLPWLEALSLVYEDKDAIYTHAGVDIRYEKDNQPRDIIWMTEEKLHQLNFAAIQAWADNKRIYHGHNPASKVCIEDPFVHSDLGISVSDRKDAALALVDVKKNRYYRCTLAGEISEHPIS